MTNKHKYILDIYDPKIYNIKLYVCKYPDLKKLSKTVEVKESDITFTADATAGWYKLVNEDKYIYLIILGKGVTESKDRADQVNTCAHEALHYVIDMFDNIGLKLTVDGQEAWTYLEGWATECIYNTLVKK